MTTSREAFEAQYRPMGLDLTRQYVAVPEPWAEYVSESTGFAWAGWQAATERAAAICGAACSPLDTGYGDGYNQAAFDCEKAIRGDK